MRVHVVRPRIGFLPPLLFMLVLAGCQSTEAPPPPPAPEPVPPEQLYPILDRAKAALEEDQLTAPSGQPSALALYREVLALDRTNEEALRGIEQIVERFVELALDATDGWRLATARSMLDRARLINPTHPSIAPTQTQVDLLSRAERDVIGFTRSALHARDAGAAGALTRLGRKSKLYACRARIRAGDDATGRWMYQQMNAAPGEARVRATMEVGLPPQVALICIPPEE